MDFLTRFQGRTNMIPKKGLDQLMTEPSTPIEKLVVESIEENPQVFVKPRQMGSIKSHRSVSNPKGPQTTHMPRESLTQFSRTVALPHPNQIGHRDSQLRLQTDPMFLEQEPHMNLMTPQAYLKNHSNLLQRTTNLSPKKQKLITSQSTYMPPKEHHSASVTPNYSLNSTKTNSLLVKTNIVVPNQSYLKADETPSSRFKLSNSMVNRTIDPNVHKHSLNEALKYSEVQNSKTQENRISLMNTFERQEKVLNKYRQGLFSEGAFHQPRMSQSKGYLPLALMSPKQELIQHHYVPY